MYLIGDPEMQQAAVGISAWENGRILQTAQTDDYTITETLIPHAYQDLTGGHLFGHDISGVIELLEQSMSRFTSIAARPTFSKLCLIRPKWVLRAPSASISAAMSRSP